jgi:tRNA pseudouridine55 synthase
VSRGVPRPRVEGAARIALVDKPEGWTSFDVVRKAKGSYRGKIGHAGTLDPFATGLLILLFGQATRVSSVFMDLPKEYLVQVRFGAVSTTGDPTGEISLTGARTSLSDVLAALEGYRGRITQRVPMTSAVKVDGERLYRKARRGELVDTPERSVIVYDHTIVAFDEVKQTLDLLVLVSKGTYVRVLAEDLGETLGVGAYAARLRRRRVGPFDVADATGPEELDPERLRKADARSVFALPAALGFLPTHEVPADAAFRAANGAALPAFRTGLYRVCGPEGLLALYEGDAGGVGRPRVVFSEPQD